MVTAENDSGKDDFNMGPTGFADRINIITLRFGA